MQGKTKEYLPVALSKQESLTGTVVPGDYSLVKIKGFCDDKLLGLLSS